MDWQAAVLDLQDLRDYLFCGLWFYLKRRRGDRPLAGEAGPAQTVPAYTTLDLPGLAVAQALGAYVTGKYAQPFPELVGRVWATWFAQKGVGDDVVKALKGYAEVRARILQPFLSGQIVGKNRQPYPEPRLTARYKSSLESSGLAGLAVSIDPPGLAKLGCAPGELMGLGPYHLADAYADSLLMAARYTPPLSETVHGVRVRTVIALPGGRALTAAADLVIKGVNSSTVEVHDYTPAFAMEAGWVGRRLDVVAALSMQAADPEKAFPPVERAVYRHFLSGKTVERRRVRPARLIYALDAARRGIEAGLFTPQFLSGDLTRCRACPAQQICTPPSGDLAEWFLPGEVDLARQVRQAAGRIGPHDPATVKKLLAALDENLLPLDLLAALDSDERTRDHEC